jgi:S1-C subfamily serine protease
MPDYLYSGKGLRIDGCKDGKPGSKAGLLKGDTIMKLGDFDIEDIYGYMEALGKFEKGQSTTMMVEREGKQIELKVTWE